MRRKYDGSDAHNDDDDEEEEEEGGEFNYVQLVVGQGQNYAYAWLHMGPHARAADLKRVQKFRTSLCQNQGQIVTLTQNRNQVNIAKFIHFTDTFL